MTIDTPRLDDRDWAAIIDALRTRLPGYVPAWMPSDGDPGDALIRIYGRYLQTLAERINNAPDKNKLAFLDLLGISLLPAQAARAPVVFEMLPDAGSSRALAGTRLGADLPTLDEPLIFETEKTIGLTAARLAEVVAVWPGKDAYADTSTAAIGGQPFTLFDALQPIPHECYFAHVRHFALSGNASVELQIELAQTGSEALDIVWEYWDGDDWRTFRPFEDPDEATLQDSLDGTNGLTRSGIIRLAADCGASEQRAINGITNHWIRARLNQIIPPDPNRALPQIDLVNTRTVISHFPGGKLSVEFGTEMLPPAGELLLNLNYITGIVSGDAGRITLTGPDDFHSEQRADASQVRWVALDSGSYTLRIEEAGFAPLTQSFFMNTTNGQRLEIDKQFDGLLPEKAIASGQPADVTKTFSPFGQQTQPGATFYVAHDEIFTKPGAEVTVQVTKAETPQDSAITGSLEDPRVRYEYWNGAAWRELVNEADSDPQNFLDSGTFTFTVPKDVMPVTINGEEAYWIRARIVSGSYNHLKDIEWVSGEGTDAVTNEMTILESRPPALDRFSFGYIYRSAMDQPEAAVTYNDFQWVDQSQNVRWRGASFDPFVVVADRTPTLYLGFDGPLPPDLVSVYLAIAEEENPSRGPTLQWEYHNGEAWAALAVRDETDHFTFSGMVEALWPGVPQPTTAAIIKGEGTDVQLLDARQAARFRAGDPLYIQEKDKGELATLAAIRGSTLVLKTPLAEKYGQGTIREAVMPRFGTPRSWIRARRQTDGDPRQPVINGIYPNAVWASQTQTVSGEILGSGNGQVNQVVFFRQVPVLSDHVIEVRELEGERAEVELPILAQELYAQGLTDDDIRTVTNPNTGRIREVWVRWQPRPNLLFSGPDDRHYVVERSRGRVQFGDDSSGRIPPAGPNNIRAASYRTGGGQVGNVPAGTISQILGAVPGTQRVSNPRAAEGGADGEPVPAVHTRGPRTVRHQMQAIALADYEALAREASPEVAVARALPVTHASGRRAPGWVKLIIMPQSKDPAPQPSLELRRRVYDYLAARTPASMAGQITVTGPDYLPVGVEVTVAPVDFSAAGSVFEAVDAALRAFLNPLYGGPDGTGWPFGRDVFQSDVAALLEALPGVDVATAINLLLGSAPQGERVHVPPNRIVIAGPVRITLTGSER